MEAFGPETASRGETASWVAGDSQTFFGRDLRRFGLPSREPVPAAQPAGQPATVLLDGTLGTVLTPR
jgi:hypothetical protein